MSIEYPASYFQNTLSGKISPRKILVRENFGHLTKFSYYFLINFTFWKILSGKIFRHQKKISLLFPVEFFPDKVLFRLFYTDNRDIQGRTEIYKRYSRGHSRTLKVIQEVFYGIQGHSRGLQELSKAFNGIKGHSFSFYFKRMLWNWP